MIWVLISNHLSKLNIFSTTKPIISYATNITKNNGNKQTLIFQTMTTHNETYSRNTIGEKRE